jgi:amyloid beta precursor protein binding protein 1
MVKMCASPVQQETRYDRQIRLWGEHGQLALEQSRVLFIGVNATTCEVI